MQSIAKEILIQESESLKIASKRINDSFDKAIDFLINSDPIIFTGVGKSGYIARKIVATLNSYGIKSIFLDAVEALHGDLGIVPKGSSAILISKSGSTDELVQLLPYLKSRNCNLIGLFGNQSSYLASNVDVNIDASVDKEACPLNLAPTSSTTLALALGDAIAGALVVKKEIKSRDFSINHPSGQLGRNTNLKVQDVMKIGDSLPIIESGNSLKNAVIEISRKSLGCVCVVEGTRFLGIITDGDIRRALEDHDNLSNIPVEEIMTQNPVSINKEEFLGLALDLMENRVSQISVLPVLENEELVGLIRIHDVYGKNID